MPLGENNDAQFSFIRAKKAKDGVLTHFENFWSNHMEEFRACWTDLLIHGARSFTKSEQLSKSFKDRTWFDKYRLARKNDELLRYMWHARNVDEHHGIALTYEVEKGGIHAEVVGGKPSKIQVYVDEKGVIFAQPLNQWTKIVNQNSPKYFLRSVIDRSVEYFPPKNHLGSSIIGTSPKNVAIAYVDYIEGMIVDLNSQELR